MALTEENRLTDKMRSELELLRRHVTLLKAVEEHQPIGIIKLSDLMDVPQHKVRYSLRVLEQEGLIEPSKDGAIITGRVEAFRARLGELLNEMQATAEDLRRTL